MSPAPGSRLSSSAVRGQGGCPYFCISSGSFCCLGVFLTRRPQSSSQWLLTQSLRSDGVRWPPPHLRDLRALCRGRVEHTVCLRPGVAGVFAP